MQQNGQMEETGLTTPLLNGDVPAPSAEPNEEDEHQGNDENSKPHVAAISHWVLTTAVLLGDMFGLGTLSLPAVFARLGWIPALSCLGALSVGGVYSGFLYTRLTTHLPNSMLFDEIGEAAMGRVGRVLVYTIIYTTILFEPVIFHITCVESLMQMFYFTKLSRRVANIIIFALIIPLSQAQHMHEVGWISIGGTIGMVLACVIVLGKLYATYLARAPDAEPPRTQLINTSSSVQSGLVGIMNIVFAYGGQVNWMRYITGMQKRRHFVRSVTVTTGVMTVFYLLVSIVGYSTFGEDVDLEKPISSVLPQDVWTIAMNTGIFMHCILAYQINVNVWCHSALHLAAPPSIHKLLESTALKARATWCSLTLVCILFSSSVAFLFPFFSYVMAIIASLGDLMSMFGLPCLFSLKLLKLSAAERLLCWGLLAFSAQISVVGVASSVHQLVVAFIDSLHHH